MKSEMTKKFIIAPSILSADFTRLGEEISIVETNGADWIHIDVMDGHFVPNITMGPFIVAACNRTTALPLDVHLMITEPERYIDAFIDAGASGLTIHVEASTHLHRTLQSIKDNGVKAGVALNPETPASSVESVLHMVDLVLVMSVNPGFSNQRFLPEVLPKAREIRRKLDQTNPQAHVQIDGGLNEHTLPDSLDAGVTAFVAANAIFNHPDGPAIGIKTLKRLLPG